MMLNTPERDVSALLSDAGLGLSSGLGSLGLGAYSSASMASLAPPPPPPGLSTAATGGPEPSESIAQLQSSFESFLRDKELIQLGLQRQLESHVRDMGEYKDRLMNDLRLLMARQLREMQRSMEAAPSRPTVQQLLDDLFARPETARGLVEWLPADFQRRARELVGEIRQDIGAGSGNGVRTSFSELLFVYMHSLGVQDVLSVAFSFSEPLGTLITQYMKNYLSSIQQYQVSSTSAGAPSSNGGAGSADDSPSKDFIGGSRLASYQYMRSPDDANDASNFETDAQRLTGALYCIKNIGNWASHNRGALGFYKQVELVAAMGAMAETLPVVAKMYAKYKDAKELELLKRRQQEQEAAEAQAQTRAFSPFSPSQPPLPPGNPPGLGSSTSWLSPHNSHSSDTRSSSTTSSPQRGIWGSTPPPSSSNAPLPSSSSAPLPGLPPLPSSEPRSTVSPPPPPPPLPGSVMRVDPRPPSPKLPRNYTYKFYYAKDDEIPAPDSRTRTMFRSMLEHSRLVDKARLCQNGPACRDRATGACPESHSYLEVMTYNPLYKLLRCTQPDHFSYADVQEHTWCVCAHVNVELNTDWMNSYSSSGDKNFNCKMYLCEHRERCRNSGCLKSHSEDEICWYNPFFRTKDCEFGRNCRFGANCLAVHEGQAKRQPGDGYIGSKSKMLFIERTHKAVADKLMTVDPRFCN